VIIGDHATISPNSLVITEIPPGATATGVPARIMPGKWRAKVISLPFTDRVPVNGAPPAKRKPALARSAPLVPFPARTPYEFLIENGKARPEQCALSSRGSSGSWEDWSWKRLGQSASAARSWLSKNLSDGAPVIIFSRRTPECIALMLGAIGARRSFSCVNPLWRWPQIRTVLASTSAKHLFVDDQTMKILADGMLEQRLAGLSIVQLKELMQDREASDLAAGPSNISHPPRADAVACYLFTSGSTGEPKGVRISEQDLFWRAEMEVAWYGLRSNDILLNLLPYSFDVGLNQILAAIAAGCETVLLESWLPADILFVVAERGVSGIPCVPAVWEDFLNLKKSFDTKGDCRRLRFITISGGDLPSGYLDRMGELALGVGVFKTYGQTEAFRGASLAPESFASHKTSVGRPFPGVSMCVVRDDGTLADCNEVGELVHAGLGLMMGYLGNDLRTNRKLRKAPFDPSLPAVFSGDHGYIDPDGYVYLLGRSDQMVKVRGNRVYPNEVRKRLCEHPSIRDAIVVAERSPTGEGVIVAFVVCKGVVDKSAVQRELRDRLPSYMMPRHFRFMEKLPRTANGKPDAEKLRTIAKKIVVEDKVYRFTNTAAVRAPTAGPAEVTEKIISIVRERTSGKYSTDCQSLHEVLDSIGFLDLVLAIEAEFKIRVDIGSLKSEALESPKKLAEALLSIRMVS
jgi:acyl-coenzyme A synthetase/AMP-(fatty) acid ligase/acyl carrier protein